MGERLTRSDIEKMQAEIDRLKMHDLPRVREEIKEARAQGDLSENYEYYAARRAKGEMDGRVRYLTNLIKNAVILEDNSASDEVGINKWVTIRFPEDGSTERYKLVTSVRANSIENRIEEQSPLAKALKGHHVGDRVHVRVNEDISYDVIVEKIENTGEEASDTIKRF
ncbi:MAG: transcription elongation factor GreA [Eubacterium sp.]|nr:transcription elongation factor GreA [Eubacterium sp.]